VAQAWGVAAILSLAGLAACDRPQPQAQPPPPPVAPVRPAVAPRPAARLPPAQTGVASYYGAEFAGRTTASGEPHNPSAMTAASRSLPLGTTAKVTNTKTGQSVAVKVNDRGPYAKGRILDVSPKAANHLGMKEKGVARVKVQPLRVPAKHGQAVHDEAPPAQ
jgi:rare lipoprotein A